MNWTMLRNSLVNQHHEKPQQILLIDHSLRQVEEGLRALAAMGHLFHLAEGSGDAGQEWPRLLYHLEAAPQGHLTLCQQDADLLGEGWFNTLDEAKHAEGMGQQFRRGGIFPKRGLPAIPTEDFLPSRLDREERTISNRRNK